MKIEIPNTARFTQTGKSLLRILQNNDIPLLDLFIREGLQNSLDAADTSKDRFIESEVIIKDFNSDKFATHLDGITSIIKRRYNKTEKYIALRDYKTNGLTGPLTQEEAEKGFDHGNLISLVYSIGRAQRNEGSGGSWGLGKTSYFRIGNGLVIYYSRIKLKNGKYQSRLVVSLVEDEESAQTLLTNSEEKMSQGLAWWGDEYEKNKTKPITNENLILEILSCFSFPIYKGDETGTSIIIPYINEKELLNDNKLRSVREDQAGMTRPTPYWYESIEEYVRVSIQRWYYPRLDNTLYRGKHFKFKINGEQINKNNMEPFFKVMTDLYNLTITPQGVKDNFKNYPNLDYKVENVNITNTLNNPLAGYLAAVKVSSKLLGETPPNNLNSAYEFANIENTSNETNAPVFAFSRKPGMIVSYETEAPWIRQVDTTKPGEYILSMFTLNSENNIRAKEFDKSDTQSLEEYVRSGEKADHANWEDKDFKGEQLKIVSRIQTNVSSKLKGLYNFKEEILEGERKSLLSGKYGDVLLPKSRFGKKAATTRQKPTGSSPLVTKTRTKKFTIFSDEIEYHNDKIIIPFDFTSTAPINEIQLQFLIATETGNMDANNYEELSKGETPCRLLGIDYEFDLSGNKINLNVTNEKLINLDFANVSSLITKSKNPYGQVINMFVASPIQIRGKVSLKVISKDVKIILDLKSLESENVDHE